MFDDNLDEFDASVKIRYRTADVLCRVELKDNMGYIFLREPYFLDLQGGKLQVFYDGDRVIGSGIIV